MLLAERAFAKAALAGQNRFSREIRPLVMENALGTALAPIPQAKKAAARVALVDLQDGNRAILSECFRQLALKPSW